jgi:uncharacterized membrane protein SpoIIM required for sporulation
MREATFINRNKPKWDQIEVLQKEDPDEMASDFIDLTADLSYAKTHYSHSKLTKYLNRLATQEYKLIFSKNQSNPILKFWKQDLPLIIGHNYKILFLASVLFIIFCALGAVCSLIDSEFIEAIMGSGYIEITKKNIANGEPFGIYARENPATMFLRIFANNFMVGLLVFLSGILFGIGTFFHIFKNGVMVGAFFTMFFMQNLGLQALFVVLLHGTIELMGLVLEGMAGFLLGLSFLFPGTLTRKQAALKGLAESSKIFIGTVPFTFLAAFIESYVTRLGKNGFSEMGAGTSIFLLLVFLGSWVFIIWYYFFYSKKIAQKIPYEEYLKTLVK